MRIVGFGTYDAGRHPRIAVLLDGFRTAGDVVTEVNVPLGLDTAWRVRILRRPWLAPALLFSVALCWVRLWQRARRAGPADAVIVGYLGHFDVHLARRLYRRSEVVLDHLVSLGDTARDRGSGHGLRAALLDRVDRAATAAADVIVVDTQEHAALVDGPRDGRVVVVPVGAPDAWFHPPQARPPGVLRVAFFGLFTPLQGTLTIARAIARLVDAPVEFSLCGNGQDLAAARALAAANPAVEWVRWIEPADLPAWAARHDVCLGIFGTGPKALRVVPNKAFQGAAAGCAIVTSDTPPQRDAFGGAAEFVPPGDDAALASVLRQLAADPDLLWERRCAAYQRVDERFRPRHVVAPLRARLEAGGAG